MSDAAWHPDPLGRYEYRWWDGGAWTEHVSTGGRRTVDDGRDGEHDRPAEEDADGSSRTADRNREPVAEDVLAHAGAPRPVPEISGSEAGSSDAEGRQRDTDDAGSAAPITGGRASLAGAVLAVAPPSRRPSALPLPPRPDGDGRRVVGELVEDDSYGARVGAEDGDRVVRQNPRLLRVTLGPDVMIKRGSMVAYQGELVFEAESEGGGVGSLVRRAVSSDNAKMARVRGRGQLYVADDANEVHLLRLDRGGLVVNGPSLLAFESGMTFRTRSLGNAGMAAAGVFVTDVSGTGWVAVTAHGTPVRLDTDAPTFVDAGAAVAWSSTLRVELNVQRLGVRSARSGELVQLAFRGEGFVLVQASEGRSTSATMRS